MIGWSKIILKIKNHNKTLSKWRDASDKRRSINHERQEEAIRARKDNDYVSIKFIIS